MPSSGPRRIAMRTADTEPLGLGSGDQAVVACGEVANSWSCTPTVTCMKMERGIELGSPRRFCTWIRREHRTPPAFSRSRLLRGVRHSAEIRWGAWQAVRIRAGTTAAAMYDICVVRPTPGDVFVRRPDLPGRVGGCVRRTRPERLRLVNDGDVPVGYVIGALDSRSFERDERDWWPCWERHRSGRVRPSATGPRSFVRHRSPRRGRRRLPHLHIDLLPEAQGRGAGRRLIETLTASLAADGSRGVHLGVAMQNENARAFYERVGFAEFARTDDTVTFVMPLAADESS
ncbi:MAG: GNAT family N-acetyltransferase [Ilumatobacteraceae bacterium]